MLLILPLMVVALLLVWATLKYGWFGVEAVTPDKPATSTSTHR